MRRFLAVLMIVLPQGLKHQIARRVFGWDLHPTARIGRSLVLAKHVQMGPESFIGAFNVIKDIENLHLGKGANIATRNWIVGVPLESAIYDKPQRDPSLYLGEYAMITVGHDIDCADKVELKDHAVIAGFRSSVLTHSLNLVNDKFVTGPVVLEEYGVLMSNCTMMTGTRVPARSVISARSVVNTRLTAERTFYRGNPAEAVRELPETLKFYQRDGRQQQLADEVARWLSAAD